MKSTKVVCSKEGETVGRKDHWLKTHNMPQKADWRNSMTQHNQIVSDTFRSHIQNSDKFLSDIFPKKPKIQCPPSCPIFFNTL